MKRIDLWTRVRSLSNFNIAKFLESPEGFLSLSDEELIKLEEEDAKTKEKIRGVFKEYEESSLVLKKQIEKIYSDFGLGDPKNFVKKVLKERWIPYTDNHWNYNFPDKKPYVINGVNIDISRQELVYLGVPVLPKLKKIFLDKVESVKKSQNARDALFKKSYELADKYNVSKDLPISEIVKLVDERAREEFRKSLQGEELSISCCGECDSWTVGEHRCSCGNRRVSLEVEGNVVSGFYGYGVGD